ncbi:hypothetical protein HK105_207927 [Polyrhizophydium stewartii]|uniref:NAD(P)-binding protein n=1 Tax=Polyrhizophydium stewartii TaxID=2732419 RepID=A0ABR4MZF2_9FUNG|nr:hypothetical protein HK105_003628 [Polyrhizophydium stewartii]
MFWSKPAFSTADIPDMSGKTVLITGGNSGVGFESAVALAAKGAHVVISCRDEAKGTAAVAEIKARAGVADAKVEFGVMEQKDLASVHGFAQWFLAKGQRLDVLMLNAGVFGVGFSLIHGVESHIMVNHLAPTLLAQLLLPKLKESAPSRMIFVSAAGHKFVNDMEWSSVFTREYENTFGGTMSQCGYSKLANIQMANHFARELGPDSDVFVNSLHPGGIASNIWHNKDSVLQGTFLYSLFMWTVVGMFTTPAQGALTQLYLAAHPDVEKKRITGRYFVPTAVEEAPSPLATDTASQDSLWAVSNEVIKRILAEKGVRV